MLVQYKRSYEWRQAQALATGESKAEFANVEIDPAKLSVSARKVALAGGTVYPDELKVRISEHGEFCPWGQQYYPSIDVDSPPTLEQVDLALRELLQLADRKAQEYADTAEKERLRRESSRKEKEEKEEFERRARELLAPEINRQRRNAEGLETVCQFLFALRDEIRSADQACLIDDALAAIATTNVNEEKVRLKAKLESYIPGDVFFNDDDNDDDDDD